MAKKTKKSRKASGGKKRPAAARRTSKTKRPRKVAYPGMMGDGTEEQNLNQRGNPSARIKIKDVVAAFRKKRS